MLTSIGLDHTDWLGETELEIAAEKLAVLRDQTTLVLGRVSPEVAALAERTAAERGRAAWCGRPRIPGRRCGCWRRAASSAATSPSRCTADRGLPRRSSTRPWSPRWRRRVPIPGRLERIAERPPTYIDAAHNPDGVAALAEALPAVVGERRVVACLAILADKDAGGDGRGAGAGARARGLHRAPGRRAGRRTAGPGPARAPRRSWSRPARRPGWRPRRSPTSRRRCGAPRPLAAEPPEGALLVAGSHYGIAPARVALGAEPAPAGRREPR